MEVENFFENSKKRFGFDAWPRRVGAAALAQTCGFALDLASRTKSWAFEQRLALGGGYCDYFNNTGNPMQRVMARVSEHQSHEDALLAMLKELTMSMAPTLPRLDKHGVRLGDVGFCGHGEKMTSLIFVRYNVLIDIRSIGEEDVSVLALAKHADAQIKETVRKNTKTKKRR